MNIGRDGDSQNYRRAVGYVLLLKHHRLGCESPTHSDSTRACKSESYKIAVTRNLNPYEPPPAEPFVSLLWDRSVLTQFGFGIHTLVLIAYCFISVDSDPPPSSLLAEVDPRFHIAMAACSAVAFAVVFTMTITKTSWPLHQRSWLIGIDLLLVGFLAFLSQGFGTLSQ